MDKNEINIKIEKGKNISKIIDNINILQMILDTLTTSRIDITMGNVSSGNLMRYSVFSEIVWGHIEEIKTDVSETINKLEEELDILIK